jgi:hypothetical protein
VFGRLKNLWEAPREVERLRNELAEASDRIAQQRLQIKRFEEGSEDDRSVKPENIVWIFGTGRSGNTWLSSMMGDLGGFVVWREPNVGFLFGYLYYDWAREGQRGTRNFILGRYKESWLNSIRNFVLDEARTRFPALSEDEYLVIKEPNGSIGAPLMMEALPESRMIFLVRDPRDTVSSTLDARQVGSWSYIRTKGAEPLAYEDPDAFVADRAGRYLHYVGKAKEAYDAHRGYKVLVRYEELRSDTLGTMKRMYSTLGIEVNDDELERVVHKHSWENIPEEEKGEGKFYRKAKPGGWREDLTPEQARLVEEITAPLMKELYPECKSGRNGATEETG